MHSYEGGALCYTTACKRGVELLGPHMHPTILMSSIPMGLSMEAWENDDYNVISFHLMEGIQQVKQSGADFFICPDNTAHIVLEKIIGDVPIPGIHIADVVCNEILSNGWQKVGLLGTKWTMEGEIYASALKRNWLELITPEPTDRLKINDIIFEELCNGIFKEVSINFFINVITKLKREGAECVILGCTEIPLIINTNNSPLPILDSTRLLAKKAVEYAVSNTHETSKQWIDLSKSN